MSGYLPAITKALSRGLIAFWFLSASGPAMADRVAQTTSLRFIDYDWALNTPANFPELR